MRDKPSKNKTVITAESKTRILEMLKKDSNVVFVDFNKEK